MWLAGLSIAPRRGVAGICERGTVPCDLSFLPRWHGFRATSTSSFFELTHEPLTSEVGIDYYIRCCAGIKSVALPGHYRVVTAIIRLLVPGTRLTLSGWSLRDICVGVAYKLAFA
jgi:hypothetical protein